MKIFKVLVVSILIIGIIAVVGGFALGANMAGVFDGLNQSDDYVEQETIYFDENISYIDIDVKTRNIIISSSDVEEISIDHYRKEDDTWVIEIVDGTLNISQDEPNHIFGWFNFGFFVGDYRDVEIIIPEEYTFDIDVKTNTGTIDVSGFDEEHQLGDVILSSDTGTINLNDIDASTIDLESDTGAVKVKNIKTSSLKMDTDTGRVVIDEVVATTSIMASTSTGSADISNVETPLIDISVNTGSIDVENVEANQIDLESNTGSIDIKGVNMTNRTTTLKTDTGSVKVNGQDQGKTYQANYANANSFYLNAETDTGSIKITD